MAEARSWQHGVFLGSCIGNLPAGSALDTSGLQVSEADLEVFLSVDPAAGRQEVGLIGEHPDTFGRRLPG